MNRLPFFVIYTCFILVSPFFADEAPETGPVVIDKETDNKIDVVKTFLRPRTVDTKSSVWVFFRDKGISDRASFATVSGSVTFTDRARARRAKMKRDQVTFGDLPVLQRYIQEISERGGRLRRISRWLNAASFEIPFGLIDEINNLPFVARIRPVAVYKRDEPVQTFDYGAPAAMPFYSKTHILDYGSSLGQLQQAHVPAVHDLGYDGSGVLVAMFDTGYRKSHEAFATAFSDGRVLAEYDFIFDDFETENEPGVDALDQHNHGTATWSTLGGSKSGWLYGPAYGASFILAKTEDVRSETLVEEDNWVAAVEWADSVGADVISSSLAYSDWYNYSDFDGETAVTTIAANLAAAYGIIVCNAMANSGPGLGSLHAPADAFEIFSCGAVDAGGAIAYFSSRGPTYDGRIKPEVCARGVSTFCATAGSVSSYGYMNGTSLSTPIIGGCAALYLSIYPSLTPQIVRKALMETASNSDNPNNTYGWGIVNIENALDWGAKIGSDARSGQVPLIVNFYDSSYVPTSEWKWFFAVDDSSLAQNPTRTYTEPGPYGVTLTVTTSIGRQITISEPYYIIAQADTITFGNDSTFAGREATISVNLTNSMTVTGLKIPVDFSTGFAMTLDSFSVAGTRADDYFAARVAGDNTVAAVISLAGGQPIAPGSGPVLNLYFTVDADAPQDSTATVDTTTIDDFGLELTSINFAYVPHFNSGEVAIYSILRGDANDDGNIDVGDAVYLANHIFESGPAPVSLRSGDANGDGVTNIGDVVYLISYIFHDGPAPPE